MKTKMVNSGGSSDTKGFVLSRERGRAQERSGHCVSLSEPHGGEFGERPGMDQQQSIQPIKFFC